jgi:SAM-dependent methyltransferase
MPAAQGVVSWPSDGRNVAALVRDDALPLEGGSIDRVLAIHCLEHADNAEELLREVWRILAPGGRVLIVVPNRTGMWARMERTPFGHGRPFSRTQLAKLLRETMFTPTEWSTALAMPPTRNRVFLRNGNYWERIGSRLWPGFSGVLIVEATKLVQQRVGSRVRKRAPQRVLSPALAPTAGIRPRTQA